MGGASPAGGSGAEGLTRMSRAARSPARPAARPAARGGARRRLLRLLLLACCAGGCLPAAAAHAAPPPLLSAPLRRGGARSAAHAAARAAARERLLLGGVSQHELRGSIASAGYHYATVALGTPARSFEVIVDTGSTMTYVPCSSCTHCGSHDDHGPYDPAASSTYEAVPCGAQVRAGGLRGAARAPERARAGDGLPSLAWGARTGPRRREEAIQSPLFPVLCCTPRRGAWPASTPWQAGAFQNLGLGPMTSPIGHEAELCLTQRMQP